MKKNLLSIILIFFVSCTFNNSLGVYEKNFHFSNQQWNTTERPDFNFLVSDTNALYNIYVIIRHTDEYKYNNIWLDVSAIPQGDSVQTQRLNLKLGDSQKWLGSQIDDVIEQRILVTSNPIKLKATHYTFILQQIMRENILQGILNAGVRIEKSKKLSDLQFFFLKF